MAVIGTIRNQLGWLMMLLVILGVAGFLFMDVASGRYGGGGAGMPEEVAKINGEPVSTRRFLDMVEMYSDNQSVRAEIQNGVWNLLLSQALIEREARSIGMSITAKEMGELFLGSDEDMSFSVRNYFGRQTGGQVDRAQLKSFIEMYSGDNLDLNRFPAEQQEAALKQKRDFDQLQEQVRFERLSQKYTSLVRKALYVPDWLLQEDYPREKREFEINYVLVPFTAVNAEVSDEELQAYINENPKRFERKANVDIEYISFKNYASAEDSAKYLGDLSALVSGFAELADYEAVADFTALHDGSMDSIMYFKKEDLTREPQYIVDSLFAGAKGQVFGPYMHNGSYRLIKLLERNVLPDSVNCEHIMLAVQTQEDYNNGLRLLDSLKGEIAKGTARFDSLAMQFSFDETSKAQGGALGFVGRNSRFGKNFEDNIFFYTKIDSMSVVASQVGQTINLHLVRVKAYKLSQDQGVRIASFDRAIIPSETTNKLVRDRANAFMTNNRDLEAFRKAAKEQNIGIATAFGLEEYGFEIAGLGKNNTSAEIIRWAHFRASKAGEVSGNVFGISNTENTYTEQLILPVLVQRRAKGVVDISNPEVKAEADRVVRNRKRLAAVAQATKGKALTELAEQYSTQVRDASFNYGVPLIGELRMQEHAVAAAADRLEPNATSGPVLGKQGIFFVNLVKKNEMPIIDANVARAVVARRFGDVVNVRFSESLLDRAKIQDNRKLVINN